MNFPYPDFVHLNNIVTKENSDCRYYLSIPFVKANNPKTMTVIMKNPSTADAFLSDPTADRVCKFAFHHEFERVVIVNLFAYRTSDPALLKTMSDKHGLDYIIGQENNSHINNAVCEANKVVVAWGAPPDKFKPKYDKRIEQVWTMLQGIPLYYVGSLSNGQYPLHGLRWSNSKAIRIYVQHDCQRKV